MTSMLFSERVFFIFNARRIHISFSYLCMVLMIGYLKLLYSKVFNGNSYMSYALKGLYHQFM